MSNRERQGDILERLCRCLAFHAVESENTSKFMTPADMQVETQVEKAKKLIAEAGFVFDAIYPVCERPIVSSTASITPARQ
ncbi:MAG: hypothetical protein JF606_26665 [Burkholderiales bacterium]|jgi:hypothetical protein|nr:hypothetical protein [Burkholderiales bacterium]